MTIPERTQCQVPGRKRTAMYMELVSKQQIQKGQHSVCRLPRMHNHFCHSIKRFFAHCVKPFLLPVDCCHDVFSRASRDAVQTEIALQVCMYVIISMHDKCNCSAPTFPRCEQANVKNKTQMCIFVCLTLFKHRHLVTFLQCQFLQCSSAKPLRQTNVIFDCSMSAPAVTEQI